MSNGKCRITGKPLKELFSLGSLYINDFVDKNEIYNRDRVELKLGIDYESGLVQLFESYPPEKMYKKYWYQSSINELMKKQLKNIVDSSLQLVKLDYGDTILDIASNDGELLTNYDRNLIRVGVDPSDVAGRSNLYDIHDIHLINDFFKSDFYIKDYNKAKIITCAAMFYDLDDPLSFLLDVEKCLCSNGIFIVQLSYLPLILSQMSFDGIGEEHLCYYSLSSFQYLLNKTNLQIFDVEINDVNSGSIRIYVTHKKNIKNINSILHTTKVREMRIESLLAYEDTLKLKSVTTYLTFEYKIRKIKDNLLELLNKIKSSGKTIYGLGASTKGNTILQYCNIGPDLITAIGERSENKFGKYTIGTGIPIVGEDEMRRAKPDYLLILPYTFISILLEREKDLLKNGTKFIVPLPKVKIYE